MTDPQQPAPLPDDSVEVTREEVELRRSPRIWRILALGAGVGAIVAFVLTFALPETQGFSQSQVFGFLLLMFITLFGALAALIVVLLDRVVGRRTVRLQAERSVSREVAAEPVVGAEAEADRAPSAGSASAGSASAGSAPADPGSEDPAGGAASGR